MENEVMSPIKAIRAKCLDCACGQKDEVKLCPVKDCPLYAFRLGKNPNRKRTMSDEQKKVLAERLSAARAKKSKK